MQADAITQRFMQPRFAGVLALGAGQQTYQAIVGTQQQGSVLHLSIAVDAVTQTVADARFKMYGCGSCIAVADLLCEQLIGLGLKQVQSFNTQDLATTLALPMVKMHCTWLAAEALEKMTTDWQTASSID